MLEDYTYQQLHAEINRRDQQKQRDWLNQKEVQARPMALDVHARLQQKKQQLNDLAQAQADIEQAAKATRPQHQPMTREDHYARQQAITGIDFSQTTGDTIGRRERRAEQSAQSILDQLNVGVERR